MPYTFLTKPEHFPAQDPLYCKHRIDNRFNIFILISRLKSHPNSVICVQHILVFLCTVATFIKYIGYIFQWPYSLSYQSFVNHICKQQFITLHQCAYMHTILIAILW